MTKLIAVDMDGTLLNDDKELPHDFQEFVDQLAKKDIKIVLASGRALYNIKGKVKDIDADFYYISDNGALVEHEGDIIYEAVLKDHDVKNIMDVVSKAQEVSVVGTTVGEGVYVEMQHAHEGLLDEYYPGYIEVDDVSKIDKKYTRLALHSFNNIKNYEEIIHPQLKDDYQAVISADVWTDISLHGINKGIALSKLAEALSIDKENIYAFGDYNNDIAMLEYAGHSYAMEEATDEVKAVADEVIGSNNDEAVIKKIKELFNIN